MTVNSVGLASPTGTLNVSVPAGGTNPVTTTGILNVDLPVQTGLTQVAGQLVTNPVIAVDKVGRVTSLSSGGPSTGVTSVGLVVNENIFISNPEPVTGAGNLSLDMVQIQGLQAGTYVNPVVTVDTRGRVMAIAGADSAQGAISSFTVESPLNTLQVTGSPVTQGSSILQLDLAPSGVVPGTYVNPYLTVNAQGIVVSAGSLSGWGVLYAGQVTIPEGQNCMALSVPGLTSSSYGWVQVQGSSTGGLMPQAGLDVSMDTQQVVVYLIGQSALLTQPVTVSVMIAGPVLTPGSGGFFVESVFWGEFGVASNTVETFPVASFLPQTLPADSLLFLGVANAGTGAFVNWCCVQPFWGNSTTSPQVGLNILALNTQGDLFQQVQVFGVLLQQGTPPGMTGGTLGAGGSSWVLAPVPGTGFSTFSMQQQMAPASLFLGAPMCSGPQAGAQSPVVTSLGWSGMTGGVVPASLSSGATYGSVNSSLYTIAGCSTGCIPQGQQTLEFQAPWITPETLFLIQPHGTGADNIGLVYPGNPGVGKVTFYTGEMFSWMNNPMTFAWVAFNPLASFLDPLSFVVTQVSVQTPVLGNSTGTFTLPLTPPSGSEVFLLAQGTGGAQSMTVTGMYGATVSYWSWNAAPQYLVVVVSPWDPGYSPSSYAAYVTGQYLPGCTPTTQTLSTTVPASWIPAGGFGSCAVVSEQPGQSGEGSLNMSAVSVSGNTVTVNVQPYAGVAGYTLVYIPYIGGQA